MNNEKLSFQGNRVLFVLPIARQVELNESVAGLRFATMLSASSNTDRTAAEAAIDYLVELGCIEFCCIGPEAELLHDAIDSVIENKDAFHVVTTWHLDVVEGCDYFINAAGGRPQCLLALIGGNSELTAALIKSATDSGTNPN